MPLGWCTECQTLRAITRLPLAVGQARPDWAPVHHDEPDVHRGCGGVVRDGHCDERGFLDPRPWCERCERHVTEPGEIRRGAGRCPGSRKPIR